MKPVAHIYSYRTGTEDHRVIILPLKNCVTMISLRINFNNDIEDMKQALPPLLLIPLVENAFKHGVSETRDQPFVDIHLSVNKRQLSFIVKNSAEAFPGEQ